MTAQRLLAAARSPRPRAGPWASGPPALAPCGGLSHPGAAHGLAGRRPDRHGTDGTLGPPRTRTPRAGATLALRSCRRGPPGLARCPVHGGGDDGGRTGRPDARGAPPTAPAFSGAHALGICQWGAASAGEHAQDWAYPCPACPGRRGRGLPLSGHSPSSSPTTPGNAPRSAPGQQREGPAPALHTGSPPAGHRQTCPAGARAWRALLWAMAQHSAVTPKVYRRLRVAATALHGSHVQRQRRRPGVVSPSAAF